MRPQRWPLYTDLLTLGMMIAFLLTLYYIAKDCPLC